MTATVLLSALFLMCGALLTPRPTAADEPTPPPGDPSSDHAAQAARLRGLMLSLEQLTLETLPEQLDQDPGRHKHLQEIQGVADALALAADRIPAAASGLELTEAQADQLRLLAGRLRSRAIDLRNRAATGDIALPSAELEPLLECCNDCHRTFDIDPMGGRRAEDD